jgi:hypothetical protein
MKIHQLLDGVPIVINNEEQHFIEDHRASISLSSLDEHDQWIAQNLVRKNVYQLTKDNKSIVINQDHETKQQFI